MENIIAKHNTIIISGPSASGKSALLQYLLSKKPEYRQVRINGLNESGKEDKNGDKVVYIAEETDDMTISNISEIRYINHPGRSSNPRIFVTQLRAMLVGHIADYHINCEPGFRFRLFGKRGFMRLYGPDYQETL